MKTENICINIFFLIIVFICIIVGNPKKYENATTLSNQKTEYIQELNEDLGGVKIKTDEVTTYLGTISDRNKKEQEKIKNEQMQLEVLKKRQQESADEYSLLSKKWQNGIYLNPVVKLKFTDDRSSVVNIGFSPDNNLPTDKMKYFNVDLNNNPTKIKSMGDFMVFTSDMNNYISFPIVYLDKFTIMCNIHNVYDNLYYTAISLTNKRNKDPGLHIDVQNNQVIAYSALPSNKPWGSALRCTRVSNHITYSYNYNPSSKNTTVKLYDNGDLVAVETKPGPLMLDKKSFERPDTCIIGRSGDNSRSFFGAISNFKFFAIDLPDEIIKKRMND